MDILGKLRLLFWGMVIGLWGLFMYQYISEDLALVPKFNLSRNPFSGKPTSFRVTKKEYKSAAYFPPRETAPAALPAPETTIQVSTIPQQSRIAIKTTGIVSVATEMLPEHSEQEKAAVRVAVSRKEAEAYPPAPAGFTMQETRNFVVYEEGDSVSQELTDTLESLHGNIMLDLVAFSPWTREKKVFIFFAREQKTYQKLTGRPVWSAGAASLSERKIYLFKSEEAFGILAHELTHIYFDSFFPQGTPSPLWLSEGIATYVQSERGNSTPNWLAQYLAVIERGGGFKLPDLVRINNMRGADEDNVRLWYAQSYSIVRFLMKLKAGDAFYQFCKNLRDSKPVAQALYQAYGMPYNKLSSLEYAWRYDMKTGKISGTTH